MLIRTWKNLIKNLIYEKTQSLPWPNVCNSNANKISAEHIILRLNDGLKKTHRKLCSWSILLRRFISYKLHSKIAAAVEPAQSHIPSHTYIRLAKRTHNNDRPSPRMHSFYVIILRTISIKNNQPIDRTIIPYRYRNQIPIKKRIWYAATL